jgi:hypothetical protein
MRYGRMTTTTHSGLTAQRITTTTDPMSQRTAIMDIATSPTYTATPGLREIAAMIRQASRWLGLTLHYSGRSENALDCLTNQLSERVL